MTTGTTLHAVTALFKRDQSPLILARRQAELNRNPFLPFYLPAIHGVGLVLPLLDGGCRRFREQRMATQDRDVAHCAIPEDLRFELHGSLDVLGLG